MGNAIWLFFALPNWYFSSILNPFAAGPLSAIPSLGIVCLAIGVVLGARKRCLGLLLFLALPVVSEALVIVAGFMRGTLHGEPLRIMLWAFVLLQVATAILFVVKMRGARLPAAALAVFTSSFAHFAAFIAAMAFSDTWI